MPWTWFTWRRKAAAWTAVNANTPMIATVRGYIGKTIVLSNGFSSIVAPVIDALGFSSRVSCATFRWRGGQHLTSGERLAESEYGAAASRSFLVTGAEPDKSLRRLVNDVAIVETTTKVVPPTANEVYVPLRYIHLTKNPTRQFIALAWLRDDLMVMLMAYSLSAGWLAPVNALAVVLASLALWISYETGYHENDMRGAKYEASPVLPDNFDDVRDSVPRIAPWLWAVSLSISAGALFMLSSRPTIPGLALPHNMLATTAILAAIWVVVLVSIRLTFGLFNRLVKPARVLPHLLLQVGKYGGYAAVSTLSTVGFAMVVAQCVYRWVPYIVYRWMPQIGVGPHQRNITRFATFWLIAIPAVVMQPKPLVILQFVVGSLFLGRRAASTLRAILTGTKKENP